MGLFGAAFGSALSTAISAAQSQSKKNTSSTASSSSGGGSSSSSTYRPTGSNTDESIRQSNQGDYDRIQQYKADYAAAQQRGDTAGMTAANNAANNIRSGYGYTGGKDGSQYSPMADIGKGVGGATSMYGAAQNTISSAYDDYTKAMQEAAEQERRAKEAAVQQSVNSLSAQKSGVQQAGTDANTAAERAYMGLLDKNGANAEALAARGLSASGLSESALTSAGNTYQGALNSNKRSVNEQLSEIDRAITNAQLTGDIATAEALASYKKAVAQQGVSSAQAIASLQQAGVSDGNQLGLSTAGLLGTLNGQQTLAGKETAANLTSTQIENQIKQIQANILAATGMTQAQLELEAQRLQNQGYSAQNAYQLLQNKYAKSKMGV